MSVLEGDEVVHLQVQREEKEFKQCDSGVDIVGGGEGVQVPTPEKPDSIPRKTSMHHAVVTTPLTPGSAYGLPDGILIPATVQSDLLQGKLLASLQQLPKQLIADALAEYDDAMTQKPEKIRNCGAYLFGVIKRYSAVAERGDGLSMGPELTPLILSKLEKMLSEGFCTQEEMNEKVKSKIRMLSEKDAIFAIDELAGVSRNQIRDFGSYFMGILNRYMRGDIKARENGKHDDRRGRSNNGTQFDHNRGQVHRGVHNRGRPSEQRSRAPQNEMGRYGDSKSYNRQGRERSRDRNDDHYGPSRNPQIVQQHYDPRRASHVGGNVPPPPPPSRPHYGMQIPYTQYQQQPLNPPYGIPQGAVLPYQQQQQQQPPHHSFVPDLHQPSYVNHAMIAQKQPMPSQPPHGMMGQHAMMSNAPAMQDGWQTSSSQQSSAQPDILGIADKAAQALAAAMGHLASHTQPPPHQMQPPMHGVPHHGTQQLQHAGPPQQPNMHHHQPAPMLNSMHTIIPTQQPPNNFNSYSTNQQPITKRRHTVAQIQELSTMVQQAVHNLHATGAIDGPLDEGMLGMIKDLPEPHALQALQKFSSMDRSNMRNKTAYLAGLLRTELAKINRR